MVALASHYRHFWLSTGMLLFAGILAVHSLAIYFFMHRFLLTRTELDLQSSRDDCPWDVSPSAPPCPV
jgi:hypothetical protein